MTYQIEEMTAGRAMSMRRTGPYGPGNHALMETFKEWVRANDLFTDSAVILGISQDHPQTTPPGRCRYDVCILVSDDYLQTDTAVTELSLPGGKYAVFSIPHTAEAVQKAWNDIFPQLAADGLTLDPSRPILERYVPAMLQKHLCEICAPV
ncbi:GyrI-like domain-containing protein [Faecalispora jeddahensis]|uniref:AraC family transcriptional regulator n=1 Tax=Faecalispora jeddahensis TaxID=1414721 RepID=UPI0027B98DB7|nr:GyrI-like domain-containing protein [Faecalispora jeddahensis]